MDTNGTSLSDTRIALVEARRELRAAEDYFHSCRLRAELELGGKVDWDTKRLGSNAEDRKRSFDAAVEGDNDCQHAQARLRDAQHAVDELTAMIDVFLDARRERDMDLRERNIMVLENWEAGRDATETDVNVQPSLLP